MPDTPAKYTGSHAMAVPFQRIQASFLFHLDPMYGYQSIYRHSYITPSAGIFPPFFLTLSLKVEKYGKICFTSSISFNLKG
jgi:hypothetical protein